ncbi:hypothetical protein GCM10023085_36260 [Actinomadura viridis]
MARNPSEGRTAARIRVPPARIPVPPARIRVPLGRIRAVAARPGAGRRASGEAGADPSLAFPSVQREFVIGGYAQESI